MPDAAVVITGIFDLHETTPVGTVTAGSDGGCRPANPAGRHPGRLIARAEAPLRWGARERSLRILSSHVVLPGRGTLAPVAHSLSHRLQRAVRHSRLRFRPWAANTPGVERGTSVHGVRLRGDRFGRSRRRWRIRDARRPHRAVRRGGRASDLRLARGRSVDRLGVGWATALIRVQGTAAAAPRAAETSQTVQPTSSPAETATDDNDRDRDGSSSSGRILLLAMLTSGALVLAAFAGLAWSRRSRRA